MTFPPDPDQPQYGDQPRYGGEQAPRPPEAQGARPRRPTTMIASFWFGIASVVVGFVALGVSFLAVSDAELLTIMRSVNQQGQQLTLEQASSLYRATLLAVVIFFVIIAGLWVMFLFFMRNGRNWARIVITIVSVLWIVLTAPSITAGSVLMMLVSLVQLLVIIGTVVFAYRQPSQEFFDSARRA